MLTTGNDSSIHEKTEQNVVHKFSEKGLYFGPQYFIEFEDGGSSRVSKKDIYNLQTNDPYAVYGSGLSPKELFITFIGLCIVGFIIFALISAIFADTKLFTWLKSKQKTEKKRFKRLGQFLKKAASIAFVAIMIICLLLVGKNILYKTIPYGKTQVEAEIVNRDESVLASPKTVITTYTLTLHYQDDAGTFYETRKDVTRFTYHLYADETSIPITYRNHHPYDIFIADQSFGEWISPLFRIETIFLLTMAYLTYFIVRKYCKQRRTT